MAGIIQSLMSPSYEPEKIALDEKDTVEGRTAGIIAKNSPLIQLANTRSKQEQNAKGTLNSTMAIQAGQVGVMDKAMQIAAPDAAMSFTAKQSNQNAQNQMMSQKMAGEQNLQQIGASGTEQRKNIGAQTESESRLIAERGQLDKDLQTADIASRKDLLDRQAAIDTELQKLRGAQNIEGIVKAGEVQTESESRLIAERGALEKQLQTADIAARKDILERQAQIDSELQKLRGAQSLEQIGAQTNSESRLIAERGAIEKQLQTADLSSRDRLLERQAQIDTQLQQLRGAQSIEQIGAQTNSESRLIAERGQIEKQLQTADLASRESLLNRQAAIDTQLQQLRGDQSLQQIGAQSASESKLLAERGVLDKQLQSADIESRKDLLARQAAIDTELQTLRGQQSQADISASGSQQRLNIGAQSDAESKLIAQRGELDKQMQTADFNARQDLMAKQAQIDTQLQTLRGQQNIEGIDRAGELQSSQNLDNFLFEKNLQQLRGEQAKQLSEIETRAGQIAQSTNSVAIMSAQLNESLASILSNPDMPPEAKDALVQKQLDAYRAQLGVIGGMTALDLTALLDFSAIGETGTPPGWTTANPVTPPSTQTPNPAPTPNPNPNPTQPPATTPNPANPAPTPQDQYQQSLASFGSVVTSSFTAGQPPTEQSIKAVLEQARNYGISSFDVYKLVKPYFPDIGFNQFLNEVTAHGYPDVAADGI